jgi:hypothetical protein
MRKLQQSTQSGFSVITVALAIAVLVALGYVGWNIWQRSTYRTGSADTSKTNVVTWRELCSTAEGLCLKYPSTWRLKQYKDNPKIAASFDIISPSQRVDVSYSPYLLRSQNGEGGGPEACTNTTISLADLPHKVASLKAAKVISDNSIETKQVNAADPSIRQSVFYTPYYYVVSTDLVASQHLMAGSSSDTNVCLQGYTRVGDSTDSQTVSGLVAEVNRAGNPDVRDFTVRSQAEDWFKTPEAITAMQIVNSAIFQ